MAEQQQGLGCIGLGVMGEPICGHLVRKSGRPVIGFDLRAEPCARLAAAGMVPADTLAAVGAAASVVFLSLPGGAELAQVAARLLPAMRAGATLVDLSTAPVDLTRELARRFADRGIDYADAPVARTRGAAERGELSVMVGAAPATFAQIEPYLRCFASDVLHCGGVGTGQVAKLMNNMVLFEIGAALAEALAIGAQSGIAPETLFEALGRSWPTASRSATTAARRCCRAPARARVLDPLRAEGSGLRAGAGRPGGHRGRGCKARARALRPCDRSGRRRSVLAGDRPPHQASRRLNRTSAPPDHPAVQSATVALAPRSNRLRSPAVTASTKRCSRGRSSPNTSRTVRKPATSPA